MPSLVARAILCIILGFFIYETINQFNKLFGLSLNPYFAIVPTVLVYVLQEWVIRKLRASERADPIDKPMQPRFDKVFYVIAWMLIAILFLVVFAVWAGVIFKEIIKNV